MSFKTSSRELIPVLGLIAVLSIYPALAQGAARVTMVAEVPFDFSVRNATYPTGEYKVQIQVLSSGQVLFLKGESHSTMALARPADQNSGPSDEAKLVFNRYGEDRYFLSEIWMPGVKAQQVPKGRLERELVTSSWEVQRITINLHPLDKPIKPGK